MRQLAFTTFAILKQPYGDPGSEDFASRIDDVFAQAEASPGFIARARETIVDEALSDFERDWGAWGTFAVPRFYAGGKSATTDARASTISIWTSIEAALAFSYSGLHLRALQDRQKWFHKPNWPAYALWWIEPSCYPTWLEASKRLEHLHDLGPTPFAFNFGRAFDSSGNAYTVNRPTAVVNESDNHPGSAISLQQSREHSP